MSTKKTFALPGLLKYQKHSNLVKYKNDDRRRKGLGNFEQP